MLTYDENRPENDINEYAKLSVFINENAFGVFFYRAAFILEEPLFVILDQGHNSSFLKQRRPTGR